MNDKNLLVMSELTPSQRRENASKAGKASAKAKRERKALRETCEMLLAAKITDDKLLDTLRKKGFKVNKSTTIQEAVLIGMMKAAIDGNPKAYMAIKDTVEPVNNEGMEKAIAKVENLIEGIGREAGKGGVDGCS